MRDENKRTNRKLYRRPGDAIEMHIIKCAIQKQFFDVISVRCPCTKRHPTAMPAIVCRRTHAKRSHYCQKCSYDMIKFVNYANAIICSFCVFFTIDFAHGAHQASENNCSTIVAKKKLTRCGKCLPTKCECECECERKLYVAVRWSEAL